MNLAILQARMSSSRLPGKVLAPVLGEPMIDRQIERLRRCRTLDRLLVATSLDPSDDPLADHLDRVGVDVFRGDLTDVLGRFCAAIAAFPAAETVVRLTADCPLADWTVIDDIVERHLASGADYTNNTVPERTFPAGLDAEAMRAEVLLIAGREADDPYEREHVTPFIYRRPDRFRLGTVSRSPSLAEHRWTVDYPEDLERVRRIYARLYPANPAFGTADILALEEACA